MCSSWLCRFDYVPYQKEVWPKVLPSAMLRLWGPHRTRRPANIQIIFKSKESLFKFELRHFNFFSTMESVKGPELYKPCLFIIVSGWGSFQHGSYMMGWHLLSILILDSNDFSLAWTMVASLTNVFYDIRYIPLKEWLIVSRSAVGIWLGKLWS